MSDKNMKEVKVRGYVREQKKELEKVKRLFEKMAKDVWGGHH